MTNRSEIPEALYPAATSSVQDVVPGYPILSEEAIGWLAYMNRKVEFGGVWSKDSRPHESWDNLTGPPVGTQHRYDLTYATFALALMADATPAWREAYSKILGFMADRMLEYWSFWDWVENKGQDPNVGNYPEFFYKHLIPPGYAGRYPTPGWAANGLPPHEYDPDPVRGAGVANMMYKGYLNLNVSIYEYVSGDDKYDQIFKVIYDDSLQFEYDHKRVTETIAKQWLANPFGISCEIRKIFAWCNNLGGLSMRLYDHLHGTSWFWTYNHWKNYMKEHYIGGPSDGPIEWLSLYYDPDIDYNLKAPEHQFSHNWVAVSWLGYPHDPEVFTRLYEGAKRQFLIRKPDGSAYMALLPGTDIEFNYATAVGLSLSRELGDEETYAALRQWVDAHYQPTYDPSRGEFYLLFGLNEAYPRGQLNDWIMPGYVSPGPRSWWRVFNQPNLRKFQEPTLINVDFPTVRVRQAYYDPDLRALNIALHTVDASALGKETTFRVSNLLRGAQYRVLMDGKEYSGWDWKDGEMEIRATIGTHTLVIQQVTS